MVAWLGFNVEAICRVVLLLGVRFWWFGCWCREKKGDALKVWVLPDIGVILEDFYSYNTTGALGCVVLARNLELGASGEGNNHSFGRTLLQWIEFAVVCLIKRKQCSTLAALSCEPPSKTCCVVFALSCCSLKFLGAHRVESRGRAGKV